ncbi:DUF6326 family protein [Janibacter alittae]|uniref:DUF6326 family protein n=1 Tax=Janibacter alittae TaxID=3115209 RepID=A0ABZ2MJG9_9MICO
MDLPIPTRTKEPMMRTRQAAAATLEDQTIPVGAKLAAAWTSFMFLYVYVDILNFYKPGVVEDILDSRVFEFDITPTWATTALILLAVPIVMIVLSMSLPARVNRIMNLIVASLQIPFAAFNVVGEVGEPWMYFYGLGVVLELIVLAIILRSAWTWPHTAPSTPTATTAGRDSVRAQQQA